MQKRSLVHRQAHTVVEALERKWLLSGSPLTSIPALNSDLGAPATLYLDFHGEAASTWGFVQVPATPAYDVDGDPTTFSAQEITNINQIWAGVAEACSPFNVNVTTVDPGGWGNGGQHQLRVVIGGSGSWDGNAESGVAYVGAFASAAMPDTVYVFSALLNNGNPTDTADIAAHEAGHGFGLNHQSVYSGTTLTSEYNPGNGITAPFMGVPWDAPRSTWWDGPNDQGYNVIQDDMSVISGSTNGFGYRALTIGQSAGAATPLSISSGSISGSGIIEKTTQTDYYSFTTGAGTDTFNMNVAQYGAMLHAKLALYDSGGNLVATAANAGTLSQSLTVTLNAGTYYIVAESYGQYGDVGQYTLSGSVVPQGSTGPSNPTLTLSGAAGVNEQATYTLNLAASDPGQTISSWAINWGDGNVQTVTGNPSSVTHAYASGPNAYTISATATDGTGTYAAGNTVAVSVQHVTPTLSISGGASVNEGALYTLMLSGSDLHSILSWTINWGDGNSQNVSGNPSSVTHTYATGPNSYTVSATATDNAGTYSAGNSVGVSVAHVPPTLSLSGASSVNEQSSYTLNLSGSDLHAIQSWSINWGDGNSQTVSGNPSSVNHTYATGPNSYTISATATDNVGTYSAGNSVGVSVLHVPPTLAISGAASVNEQSAYTLNLSGTDLHTIVSWTINWGDGNTSNVSGNPSSVTHTYASGPNLYTVQASATDNVGTYSAGNSVAVSVAHVPPTLSISGAATVNEGSLYTLSLSGSDLHTIQSWSINWGDGTTQTVTGNPSSATHTYAAGPNAYTISAHATDNAGTYAAGNSVAVSVQHVAPTLSISGAASVNQESAYTLSLNGSDTHSILSWAINWGDGTAVQTVSGNPSSVTHIYVTAPLTPTISATATDNAGTYSAANTVQLNVNAVPVSVALSGAASVSQGSPFALTIGSVVDAAGTPSSFIIHWGDGASDTVSAAGTYNHVFNTAGTANVSVDVIDQNGTHAAAGNLAVSVAGIPFTANISGPSSVAAGDTYTLALSASEAPNQSVSQWTINWGDGSGAQVLSGNPASATHVFGSAGNFVISASAVNGQGTANSNALGLQVLGAATFGISGAPTVYTGSLYTLLLSATDPANSVTGWSINWGDGSVQSVSGNPASITHTYTVAATDVISATASDSSGSSYAAANTVMVAVQVPDVIPPTASASLPNVTAPGTSAYLFQIVYSDNVAIDASTLGNTNVVVTGPNGYAQDATLVSVSPSGSGAVETATYSIAAPNGAWTSSDGGSYTVSLNAGAVTDTSGNAVTAGAVGSFQVAVPTNLTTLVAGTKSASSGTLAPGGQALSSIALSQPLSVTFGMTAQRAGISLQVTDASGNVVLSRSARQFSAAVTLSPGTYNVAISYTGTLSSKYTLTLTPRAVAAKVYAVGAAQPATQNTYWFTLTQPMNVNVALSASGAVNVQLLDLNANVLFSQAGAKLSGKLTLGPGSYCVQVGYAGQIVNRYLVSTTNSLVSATRRKAKVL